MKDFPIFHTNSSANPMGSATTSRSALLLSASRRRSYPALLPLPSPSFRTTTPFQTASQTNCLPFPIGFFVFFIYDRIGKQHKQPLSLNPDPDPAQGVPPGSPEAPSGPPHGAQCPRAGKEGIFTLKLEYVTPDSQRFSK